MLHPRGSAITALGMDPHSDLSAKLQHPPYALQLSAPLTKLTVK